MTCVKSLLAGIVCGMTDTQETAGAIFGRRLQALRQRARISQAELAELMTEQGQPLSQVTVGRLEAARRPVNVDELAALARIFKVTMADLVAPLDRELGLDVSDELIRVAAAATATTEQLVKLDPPRLMDELEKPDSWRDTKRVAELVTEYMDREQFKTFNRVVDSVDQWKHATDGLHDVLALIAEQKRMAGEAQDGINKEA